MNAANDKETTKVVGGVSLSVSYGWNDDHFGRCYPTSAFSAVYASNHIGTYLGSDVRLYRRKSDFCCASISDCALPQDSHIIPIENSQENHPSVVLLLKGSSPILQAIQNLNFSFSKLYRVMRCTFCKASGYQQVIGLILLYKRLLL